MKSKHGAMRRKRTEYGTVQEKIKVRVSNFAPQLTVSTVMANVLV